jgi:hypothetical protein
VGVVGNARPTSLGADVGDSKALVSHGNYRLAEAWTRAILGSLGRPAASPRQAVDSCFLDTRTELTSLCPRDTRAMCFDETDDTEFVNPTSDVDRLRDQIAAWSMRGCEVAFLRVALVCPKRLNLGPKNKLEQDLAAMERLLLAAHRDLQQPLDAIAGKVGGMQYYVPKFTHLSAHACLIEHESRAESAYRVGDIGRLRFLVDADSHDPLVGLASLVGKYIREQMMARLTRFFRQIEPALAAVSGYRDPNTAKFVAATDRIRQTLGLPDDCFFRP